MQSTLRMNHRKAKQQGVSTSHVVFLRWSNYFNRDSLQVVKHIHHIGQQNVVTADPVCSVLSTGYIAEAVDLPKESWNEYHTYRVGDVFLIERWQELENLNHYKGYSGRLVRIIPGALSLEYGLCIEQPHLQQKEDRYAFEPKFVQYLTQKNWMRLERHFYPEPQSMLITALIDLVEESLMWSLDSQSNHSVAYAIYQLLYYLDPQDTLTADQQRSTHSGIRLDPYVMIRQIKDHVHMCGLETMPSHDIQLIKNRLLSILNTHIYL